MWQTISDITTFVWLFCLMFQMGTSVTVLQIADSLKKGGIVWKSLAANLLLVPLVGFALLLLFDPKPILAAGFMTGVVFSGAPMAPTYNALAKGDGPLSIGLMFLLTLLSVGVSPLLLKVLMAGFSGADPLHVDYPKIMTVVTLGQLLPLSGGLALNRWKQAMVRRTARPIRFLNVGLLLAVCFVVIPVHWHGLIIFGWRALAGMAALFFASVITGWLMGGPGTKQRKALVFNTTIRNIPAAMAVASVSFPGSPAIAAVFAYGLFTVLGTLALALLGRLVSTRLQRGR